MVEFTFQLEREVDKRLFIAEGTGIARMLQLAANSLARRRQIFWAVGRRKEAKGVMVEEVGRLVQKIKGRVSMSAFWGIEGGVRYHWEKVWSEEQRKLRGKVKEVLEESGGEVTVFEL
ncbi:hypothetical protein HOY80DRAFT_1032395 [Tuber brumale]|nr:hypothetical protein HOY80DRAFT_1032395 [Tuber brumale]